MPDDDVTMPHPDAVEAEFTDDHGPAFTPPPTTDDDEDQDGQDG